jgi:hypothetical protein
MRERVVAMSRDTSGGWDLCVADRVALFHVMTLVHELACDLAKHKCMSMGETIAAAEKAIEERAKQ